MSCSSSLVQSPRLPNSDVILDQPVILPNESNQVSCSFVCLLLLNDVQFRNSMIPGPIRREKRIKRVKRNKTLNEKEKTCGQKFQTIIKNAWYYDCNVRWYHFNGKGAAWLVILTPFILLFGPFLMSCYIFNLNKV